MVKLDHMRLPVTDPKASRDWYVTNFGLEVEFENPSVIALKDDVDFTIFLYPPETEPGKGSLAGAKCGLVFQVKDVDAKHRELVAQGVAFEKPPGKYFWGYGAELSDPDGYILYLWDEVSMREKGGG
jgi:catechol 2,3-dioxygenase-like lactoylglutathione lyase family enzyme